MTTRRYRRAAAAVLAAVCAAASSGCGWRGVNSLPLPGTQGSGPQAYVVLAQLPDVTNIQQNSRVRVGDVTVGNISKVERQGWHALVTMTINGDVVLPANATATVGQTSLLGSLHVELAPPADSAPEGTLKDRSLIPLSSSGAYPTTEQTLTAVSLLLTGGGLGHIQDITHTFSTAFAGREDDLRSLIEQLDTFVGHISDQSGDILAATESLNRLAGQLAAQEPVLDRAFDAIPAALAVLEDDREALADTLVHFGRFSAVAAESVDQTKDALIQELHDMGPVLAALAGAGPDLTRSLSFLSTFPWAKETLTNWVRGDYANLTAVVDLTLSRIDTSLFTGTRFEGDLTRLEMQWGRTIGQFPSPATVGNPLVVPYHSDQGP